MNTRRLVTFGLVLIGIGAVVIIFSNRPTVTAPDAQRRRSGANQPTLSTDERSALDTFLADHNDRYRDLWTAKEGGAWIASTNITAENSAHRVATEQALASYIGSVAVIEQLRRWRGRAELNELDRRQLEVAWQEAAHYPATIPDTVNALLATEAVLEDSLFAHDYWLTLPGADPRRVSPNQIDSLLVVNDDLPTRQAVWECSKEVGPGLRPGLVRVRDLRNTLAREMDFRSFFDLETADYGMSDDEMLGLCAEVIEDIKPLYDQLHCWMRYELAARYGVAPPRLIPAHWLGNRWGQSWPGIVEGIDLDALFAEVTPQWIMEQGERFYVSLGFAELPATFWERSDLFPLAPDATRKKNTHASAWHIDLDQDVRSLMSVENNFRWFGTAHHELGHIYYYLAYARPEVPPLLRRGANRAFHEGIGSLIEVATTQVPYLVQVGLLDASEAPDRVRWLLSQALVGPIVFLPFACGTMTHWEYDFYSGDLPAGELNARWWEHAARFQGIAPPGRRGEEHLDPATKTHVVDDPAQYYDYALSDVLLHQLHRYICREILETDVWSASYFGRQDVGIYLDSILSLGATRDWQRLLKAATGEELSSQALLEYFAPLQEWLVEQNTGREVGF